MTNRIANKGVCPCCGRFAGAVARCEYCDSDLPRGDLLILCRRWCGLFAVLSLALLWNESGGRAIEQIAVEDIGPSMNHALVRVLGRIVSDPYVKDVGTGAGYVSFILQDAGSPIRICLQGNDAADFLAQSTEVGLGTRIDAVGVLQIRAGAMPKMYVRSVRGASAWKPVMQ